MPLLRIESISALEDSKVVLSEPRSTGTLWRWLSHQPHRHRHAAAIIFRTVPEHWPADLYLQITPDVGLSWTTRLRKTSCVIEQKSLQEVDKILNLGAATDLRISVSNSKALGSVLHSIRSSGFKTWDRFDESMEIVFGLQIQPHLIGRVVALYRTNRQFKQRRPLPGEKNHNVRP